MTDQPTCAWCGEPVPIDTRKCVGTDLGLMHNRCAKHAKTSTCVICDGKSQHAGTVQVVFRCTRCHKNVCARHSGGWSHGRAICGHCINKTKSFRKPRTKRIRR